MGNWHTLLRNINSDLRRDFDHLKTVIDADPFYATTSGMRDFYVGSCLLLKVADTGSGSILARKRMPKVQAYHLEVADCTGVIERIHEAAYYAFKKVCRDAKANGDL